MKRLRNLGTRISKSGRLVSWAEYECPFCFAIVERPIGNGERCESCGCKRKELISKANKGKLIGEKNPMYGKFGELNPFYGKKHTEEVKKSNSEAHKGKIPWNKGMLGLNSGENNPFYGKKHTDETIEKQSEVKKGKYLGENNPFYGKKHTEETRQKIKDNHIDFSGKNNPMYGKIGELSPNWQGGKSFEIYPQEFNKELKQLILERDNYTCQDPNCKHLSERLHVHHIDYDKTNNDPENLTTLCNSCHSKTNSNSNRKYWIEFYQNIMMYKLMECLL